MKRLLLALALALALLGGCDSGDHADVSAAADESPAFSATERQYLGMVENLDTGWSDATLISEGGVACSTLDHFDGDLRAIENFLINSPGHNGLADTVLWYGVADAASRTLCPRWRGHVYG